MTGTRADAEHVLDLLGPDSGMALRRFFGGWSLVHAGTQVGIVMDTVYVKVDRSARQRWRDRGATPFRYRTGARTVTVEAYWSVPPEALDDGALLRRLLLNCSQP